VTERPRATFDGRTVTASIDVDAPPEEVFALLADPRRHTEIDGSGSVQGVVSGPERLALGATFGMSMKIGAPYRVVNTVVEFEEGRRIAWCHFAKARWRYRLTPIATGTTVTETFDWSGSSLPVRLFIERTGFPKGNAKAISETLVRLQQRFATG
jgi:uncharacterized protein YndB with AHSA1/START domain